MGCRDTFGAIMARFCEGCRGSPVARRKECSLSVAKTRTEMDLPLATRPAICAASSRDGTRIVPFFEKGIADDTVL